MSENDDTPTMYAAITSAIERRILSMFGPMPGRVTSYDSATQKASVQPLIFRSSIDESGARIPERLPIVPNVPIMFPGSGSYRFTFPVAVGDTVLLVFADSSLDRWLQHGGEVDPEETRHFDASDAIAIPGLFHFGSIPTSAPTDAAVIHGDVKLGSPSATSAVSLHTDLTALANVFSNWTPVGTDGGAALKTLLTTLINTGWPFGSTTTKAL